MTSNRIKFNDSKIDSLLVHGKTRPHEFPLIAGDVQIVSLERVRTLGVILDSKLTMTTNFNSICTVLPGLRSFSLSKSSNLFAINNKTKATETKTTIVINTFKPFAVVIVSKIEKLVIVEVNVSNDIVRIDT